MRSFRCTNDKLAGSSNKLAGKLLIEASVSNTMIISITQALIGVNEIVLILNRACGLPKMGSIEPHLAPAAQQKTASLFEGRR
jgi:hypothetical protein